MARANRLTTVLALSLALTGCLTTKTLREGQNAEFLQEYDRAILEYTKTLRENPDNKDARQGLERTKLRSSLDHFARGRRLSQGGRLEDAAGGASSSPDTFMNFFLGRLSPAPYEAEALDTLKAYLTNGGAWTGARAQVQNKGAGLARLIVGSAEYQLV